MSIDDIQRFINNKTTEANEYVKITFKKRDPVFALFVKDNPDFKELKAKNFWRMVLRNNFEKYNKSKSLEFTRIFLGSEFSKLTPYAESFV
jgi:hypothetical protein